MGLIYVVPTHVNASRSPMGELVVDSGIDKHR